MILFLFRLIYTDCYPFIIWLFDLIFKLFWLFDFYFDWFILSVILWWFDYFILFLVISKIIGLRKLPGSGVSTWAPRGSQGSLRGLLEPSSAPGRDRPGDPLWVKTPYPDAAFVNWQPWQSPPLHILRLGSLLRSIFYEITTFRLNIKIASRINLNGVKYSVLT